jgi:hypothetical protein
MSKLAEALRAKFKDPRKVLAALGLDESLLQEARAEALKLAQDAGRRGARDDFVRTENNAWSAHPSVQEAERLANGHEHDTSGGEIEFDGITSAHVEQIARLLREAGVDSNIIKRAIYALVDESGAQDDEAGTGLSTLFRLESEEIGRQADCIS